MGSSQSVPLQVKCYECNRVFNPKVTRYTYICPQCKSAKGKEKVS